MVRNARVFINPYHFIPLPGKIAMFWSNPDDRLYTGKLTYRLTAKTPLFIPNTSNDHTFRPTEGQPDDHLSYDFFSYRNRKTGKYYDSKSETALPVIPGSEVRGMFRSVYETLTDSCLSALPGEEEVISRRTMEYQTPGLIRFKGEKLYLHRAEDYIYYGGRPGRYDPFYRQCPIPEGAKVAFDAVKGDGPRSKPKALRVEVYHQKADLKRMTGYLIKGNHGIGLTNRKLEKHNCHIFVLQGQGKEIRRADITRFQNVLDSYAKQSQDKQEETAYQEYTANAKEFLRKKEEESCFPVYYSNVGSSLYLSPACVSRECYENNIRSIVGDFKPCSGKKAVCPACALFGMIGEDNKYSRASKIRFSDLTAVQQDAEPETFYTEVTTIPALGQPKLSNTEFYLKHREGASLQTFDYYIVNGKIVEAKPEIAGRKFYWHQQIKDLPKASERTRLNRTIRAVRPDKEFQGTVYFDRITEGQLRQLVWMLNLGANMPEKGYKLGMGKPLGMGSVTVRLAEEGNCLRQFVVSDGKIHYDISEKPLNGNYNLTYEEARFSAQVKQEFLFMADLHAADGWTVSYPYANPDEAEDNGYEWYTNNHKSRKGNSPRKRIDMDTVEHLRGFGEIAGRNYHIANFALPVRPGENITDITSSRLERRSEERTAANAASAEKPAEKKKSECVWVSPYKMDSSQEGRLRGALKGMKIHKKEGKKPAKEELAGYGADYAAIALPSGTKKDMIEEAKKHFTEVYVAAKSGSRDNGWKKQ